MVLCLMGGGHGGQENDARALGGHFFHVQSLSSHLSPQPKENNLTVGHPASYNVSVSVQTLHHKSCKQANVAKGMPTT